MEPALRRPFQRRKRGTHFENCAHESDDLIPNWGDLGLIGLSASPQIKNAGRWFGILPRSPPHFLRTAHLGLDCQTDGRGQARAGRDLTQSGQEIFLGE